jgi:hypothetical protein
MSTNRRHSTYTRKHLERAAGIEPASSAWKAEVLPLNYARLPTLLDPDPLALIDYLVEGEGFEPSKLSRQIYSLLPLATREPLQMADHSTAYQDLVKRLFISHLPVRTYSRARLALGTRCIVSKQ